LCALDIERPESGEIMTDKHPKRPRDPNQLAKSIIDIATGQKRQKNRARTRRPLNEVMQAAFSGGVHALKN
jgi:hypothetical protein